jgi:hypothetical protein
MKDADFIQFNSTDIAAMARRDSVTFEAKAKELGFVPTSPTAAKPTDKEKARD